jgi:hypothetical protein
MCIVMLPLNLFLTSIATLDSLTPQETADIEKHTQLIPSTAAQHVYDP